MKKLKLFVITLILVIVLLSRVEGQNIAITDDNAYTAHSSAMLDVKSLTKGFLTPRMTTAQRIAIPSPATGLLVFDTSINGYYYYNGSAWINLTSGSSSGLFWSYNSPNIYMSTGTDKLGLGTSTPSDRLIVTGTTESTTRMKIGYNGSYNNIESGRLAFDENVSGAGVCGFEFHFDGSVNKLFLDAGCTAMSNIMTFERGGNIGIGTTTPETKLIVKGSSTTGIDEAIFAVQNTNGDTVFAVYPEGVRIWVNDAGGTKANGSRGGFAVGGFNPAKAGLTNEYFRVTPDSVRVYIDDDFNPAKANGSRGGFAVGGFNPAKGTTTDNYLFVQDDSTRVYVIGDEGFAVDNIAAGSEARYMDLTPENYLIGHESGQKITNGKYNTFFGYQTGYETTGGIEVQPGEWEGSNNIFIGYQSGYDNATGYKNVFMGYKSGANNTSGRKNTFIGNESGGTNTTGGYNTFLGYHSGIVNSTGQYNTFLGSNAGFYNSTSYYNVCVGSHAGENLSSGAHYNTFIGTAAGHGGGTPGSYPSVFISGDNNTAIGYRAGFSNTTGSGNVFLGYNAGYNETGSNKLYIDNSTTSSPLIYGDFSGNEIEINGYIGVATNPGTALHVERSINASATPTNHVALIKNTSTGTSPDVLALQVGYAGSPSTGINFITFLKGGDIGIGAIEGNGTGGITLNTTSADYAEYLERINKNEIIESGDVVGVFGGKITRNTKNADLIMAISSGPIVLGNNPGEDKISGYEKVGFMGQVPVKVSGKVGEGDFIITSGKNDGTAIAIPFNEMLPEYYSRILGLAWESSSDKKIKLIKTGIGIHASNKFLQMQLDRINQIEKENQILKQHTEDIEKLKTQLEELKLNIYQSAKK